MSPILVSTAKIPRSHFTPFTRCKDSAPPLTHTFHLPLTLTLASSPPPSPMPFLPEGPQPRPHGKRRDPSYIPRPPNAFILFRSAFIRDQNIPGKVEGNHSKLSKIIGLCWKQLPAEEREKWEARAVDAQAEHRTRYPDWRFRPGANARLKAGESSTSATRRRSSVRGGRTRASPSKDGDDAGEESEPKPKEKGKSAKSNASRMPSIEETRCAKIASFVAEGLKGEELELAVRQWEDDRRIARPEARPKKPRPQKSRKASSGSQPSPVEPHSDSVPSSSSTTQPVRSPTDDNNKPATSPPPTENPVSLSMSSVPLTHMFKRHSSLSRSEKRLSSCSDESSLEDVSQTSAEPENRPRTWGTLPPEKDLPKRPPADFHIREGSLPIPPTPSTSAFETQNHHHHHLAWQGGENQHPNMEESHPWWHRRSTPVESPSEFNFDSGHKEQDGAGSMVFGTDNMGYETHASESPYDRSFMEPYRPYEAPQDDTTIQWTNLSASGMNRQGLGTIIEDPYKDDCCTNDASRPLSEPSTLSIAPPPSSSSAFYYSSRPPPSSSYSALSGWAGDYKSHHHHHHPIHEGTIKNWPDQQQQHTLPNPPSALAESASSAWYDAPEMYNWSATRSQLQHGPLSVDAQDWDRHEQRVAGHMDLRSGDETPRHLSMDFHDQLHGAGGS